MAGLKIAVADLSLSCAHRPSLPHLWCNPIGDCIFHGHLLTALQWNPLAFLFYCALSLFNAYALATVVMRTPRLRVAHVTPGERKFVRGSAIALLALNWAYLLLANPTL